MTAKYGAALAEMRRRGLKVILAGNQPPQAKAALQRMDLPVDEIFTSAEWGVEKPDPAFFRKVAEVAGAEWRVDVGWLTGEVRSGPWRAQ